MSISKKTVSRAGEIYSYKGEIGEFGEFQINLADCALIDIDDAVRLAERMMQDFRNDISVLEGKNYLVFARPRGADGNVWFGDMCISFPDNELPDYLKKYVE